MLSKRSGRGDRQGRIMAILKDVGCWEESLHKKEFSMLAFPDIGKLAPKETTTR